ncbi:MAG TPA: VOC family protein, partial [Caulobacter sp.]
MARVLGLGGVFFKAADPAAVREWYARVLGFTVHDWGGA